MQLNANVLNSAFGITINTNGDAVDVDCNQFEAGAFATTPIPSAGVRNGDMLTFQFSGNALAASGSAYAECYTLWATSAASGVAIGFGNAAATTWPICVDAGRASTGILCRDGTNAPTKLGLTDMNAGSRKRASSWGAAGLSVTGDGAAPATSAFDGDEGSTAVAVGCNTTDATTTWYGAIKNVRLWQSQLPDGLLSQITNGPA